MGYVDSNLMSSETVMYRTRLHKIMFFWPIIFALAFCGLGFWVSHQDTYKSISGMCYILAIIVLLPSYIKYISTEFVVTNKRVIVKVGFIRRHTVETLLQKIEAVEVKQTILGRIANYGTLSVIGTGGTTEPFQNINNPLAFRRAVDEQTDASNKAKTTEG
jgi:uncharacterized membrane protein YdbT with pleckstrin-like domain